MFDIGFSELLVIGVVALVVIGPERLPRVARTAGHLLGRLQRYVAGVKADIAREMELEELRKFKSDVEDTARSVSQVVSQEVSLAEAEMRALASQVEATPNEPGEPAAAQSPAQDSVSPQLALPLAQGSAESAPPLPR